MTENGFREGQGAMEADRIEREALEALRGEGNSGPLLPLDEIARRRFVDGVLAADTARNAGRERRWGRREALAAAGLAGLAAAVVVAIAVGTRPGAAPPPEAIGAPGGLDPARVLLASGEATVSGARARAGGPVEPGARLRTGAGELRLGLPTGLAAALSPETAVSVVRLDREALVLGFEGGSLLISAVPGRRGPRLTVRTRDGDVTVKGTVLRIDDRAGTVEVVVARGVVEVGSRRGGGRIEVGPSEALALDGGPPRASTAGEDADLLGRAAAFDVLDPASEASVDLRSAPSGAGVEIDGLPLGTTPLSAAVRAGHRRLALSLEGHHPVSEIISVEPASDIARYFELRAIVGEPVEDGGAPEAEPAADRPAPKVARPATAQELLFAAQDLRAARDFPGAAAAYRELLRRHPSSDEARAALVSLGQLEVDRLGSPAAALRRFDAYLGLGGGAPLRAEALLGRARSLRALGRNGEERQALERFLAEHPEAIQAAAARKRLDDLRGAAPAGTLTP